jgi:MFS transporter, putative metabolite:H+ symporter
LRLTSCLSKRAQHTGKAPLFPFAFASGGGALGYSAVAVPERFTPYQRKLFFFLGVATFFEGYDFIALSQILPELRASFGLGPEWSGYILGFVNLGSILAYFLVRLADRWGRRRVLTLTIAGYTVFTFLSGLAPDVYSFAVLQLFGRIFLLSEWAISMVIAAEEFPAHRRGVVIGVITGINGIGAIVCALAVPHLTALVPALSWRMVYFVAVVPLVLLAVARRGLRETERFEAQALPHIQRSLFHVWSTPYRGRILALGAIWFVSYIAAQNAVSLWKEHAVHGLGFTSIQVADAIAISAGAAMPCVFAVGFLVDRIGRKPTAAIVYTIAAAGTYFCFTLESFWPVTIALIAGITGAQAYLPVLNAYTTELFPTDLRGDAYAWSNNLIGRIAYVGAPAVVGGIVQATGLGYGAIIAPTAIFPIIAMILIFTLLPETRARELEDTSALST